MATLDANIDATEHWLTLDGDVTASKRGSLYSIDDEIVQLRAFEFDAESPTPPWNMHRWRVYRGASGSTAASHTAGAAIVAATDAFVSGTTLARPNPLVGGGSGSGLPSQWTDGGHGDVTIDADDSYSPITVAVDPNVYTAPTIRGSNGAPAGDAAIIIIQGGTADDGNGAGGGLIEIDGGFSNGVGGGGDIVGANGAPSGGAGGPWFLTAGNGVMNEGGGFTIRGGDGDTGYSGGTVLMAAGRGNGGLTQGPSVQVSGGTPTADGDIQLVIPSTVITLTLSATGFFIKNVTTAPSDGDLAAGIFALWMDTTPGSAKLMIKAKDDNGAVVTGSVNLS